MRRDEAENLVRVKLALADKYERQARTSRSKPRRAVLHRRAERVRRQAEDARRAYDLV